MVNETALLNFLIRSQDQTGPGLQSAQSKLAGFATVGKAAILSLSAATVAIVGALTAAAEATVGYAGEVRKLQRELGTTAEDASRLSAVGRRLGLDTDDLSLAFGTFSKKIVEHRGKLEELGVTVVKTKDGHVDFGKTLESVADRFKAMPDGVEKSALSMELFGKRGKDLIPLLDQGSSGIHALGDEAKRMGLIFDQNALEAAKRYTVASKQLHEATEGLRNQLGLLFLPVLADVAVKLADLATNWVPLMLAGFARAKTLFNEVAGAIGEMFGVLTGKTPAAGGLLRALIGDTPAETVMALLAAIGKTWTEKIKPFFEWAEENIPKFWATFKTEIEKAWKVAKPQLEDLVKKLEDMKTAFDNLPEPVKKMAGETAAAAIVIKVTGLDDKLTAIANAAGNVVQAIVGAGGLLLSFSRLGLGALAVVGSLLMFLQLSIAIGMIADMTAHSSSLFDALMKLATVALGFLAGVLVAFSAPAALFIGTFVLVAAAVAQVGETVQLVHDNWDTFVLALKTGKLNDIPIFGLFFHMGQDILTMIANIISAWENLQRLLGGGKSGGRSGGGASGGGGGGGGEGDVISAQHGFAGLVTRPTLFLAGEGHRTEYVSVTPRGQGTGGAGHAHPIIIELEGRVLADVVGDYITGDTRGKGRGLG